MQGTGATAGALATFLGHRPEVVAGLRRAGALHDIGKTAIPAEILGKPGPLSAPSAPRWSATP